MDIGIYEQTRQVRAICVTSNNVSDTAVTPELLAQVSAQEPLLTVTRDESCDTQPVDETVMQRNATLIIPPSKDAKIRKGDVFAHRNAAIAGCRRLGLKRCKS